MTSSAILIVLGLALVTAGGATAWHAVTTKPANHSTNHEQPERTGHAFVGALLVALGVGCILVAVC